MADLESMSRDELLKLCKDRGGQLVRFVEEFQYAAGNATDKHVQLQSEYAATLAEFEDLKQQHETILKRLQVAERLVEQQQVHIRRLKRFGELLIEENTNNE